MSQYGDSSYLVWSVGYHGNHESNLFNDYVCNYSYLVRPVITLKKTVLVDNEEIITEDKDEGIDEVKTDNITDDKKETTTKVKVENTYMESSVVIILIGYMIMCVSTVTYCSINREIRRRKNEEGT